MALTGANLKSYFNQKIGHTYTGFFDNTKLNRIFRDALFMVCEERYLSNNNQKTEDEITSLIKTNKTFTPVSNQVSVNGATPLIANYWHLLAISAKFTKRVYDWTITGVSRATPIVVTIDSYNNFRTGEQLVIASVGGNTNANGTHYIKKVGNYKFALYSDENFLTPIVGNAAWTSGGTISRVNYNYCRKYNSDQKIGVLNIPTTIDPMYEITEGLIKIYPLADTCTQVTVDYVVKPPVEIDVANTSADLTLTYTDKLLYHIVDVAAKLAAVPLRDQLLYTEQAQEVALNK